MPFGDDLGQLIVVGRDGERGAVDRRLHTRSQTTKQQSQVAACKSGSGHLALHDWRIQIIVVAQRHVEVHMLKHERWILELNGEACVRPFFVVSILDDTMVQGGMHDRDTRRLTATVPLRNS